MVNLTMIGTILGNYRILKKIGEGGMGSVYLTRDLSLEREVAIKVIAPDLARNPGLMARFRAEAIAQAYYCDGKKDQALIYDMKALELDGYLNFSIGYQSPHLPIP